VDPISIARDIWVAATPERVWQAITEPALLERWYAPGCPWEIPTLAVGAPVRFHNTPEEVLAATIVVLDAPRELTLRWQASPDLPGAEVTTSFRLAAEAGGTVVSIHEWGFESLPAGQGPAHAAQAAEGYAASLAALKALLEEVPA
jgi:uncharacterized protein YndB with AHSA1/START domain